MSTREKALAAAAIVIVTAVLAFFLSRPSDEDQVKRTLDRLASAASVREDDNILARAARLKSELKETVDDDVRVDVPELGLRVTGRKKLVEDAAGASAVFGQASCALTQVKVQLDPSKTAAKADAVALVTATRGGERRVDRRDVHFLLRKDGAWRVTSVSVLPEAPP